MEEDVQFSVNGKPVSLRIDSDRMFLWVLRIDLGLRGTKYGCGEGHCGACAVLINGEAVRSCQMALRDVRGKEVVTIEGLAQGGKLHPLQKAFMEMDALQCGYCTPGMIVTAVAFLQKNSRPSTAEILAAMDNNLCRCGAHNRIIQAIQAAASSPTFIKGGQGGLRKGVSHGRG